MFNSQSGKLNLDVYFVISMTKSTIPIFTGQFNFSFKFFLISLNDRFTTSFLNDIILNDRGVCLMDNGSIFINEFLTIGFADYYSNSETKSFERHIVECLVTVYGSYELKNCFDRRDENGFQSLLTKYGFKLNLYENFLRDTTKYEQFKEENIQNPNVKSDIASVVECDVINMFLFKCLTSEPSFEELGHFENDLLNDFSIIKMHFNTSINPNRTREYWSKKKKILTNNIDLIEIKPDLLASETYAKFGIKIEDVAAMDPRMIKELNSYISSKMAEGDGEIEAELPKPKTVEFLTNTAISSGNGYVDALVVISIIATELSLGLIYIFLHLGG